MAAALLLLIGVGLVVAGVAMWSVPAALVVAGSVLATFALLVDLARLGAERRAAREREVGGA